MALHAQQLPVYAYIRSYTTLCCCTDTQGSVVLIKCLLASRKELRICDGLVHTHMHARMHTHAYHTQHTYTCTHKCLHNTCMYVCTVYAPHNTLHIHSLPSLQRTWQGDESRLQHVHHFLQHPVLLNHFCDTRHGVTEKTV